MVEKGSIAVDGVSLTVAARLPDGFTVALIPHTMAVTTLGPQAVGRAVNLEVDVVAKYVESLAASLRAAREGRRMTSSTARFATVADAIEEIRAGRMVVILDSEDRENEGDLVMAAQFATPEAINFMATHGRGLICLALTEERCDQLGLKPMVRRNETPNATAFTEAIEARHGITTGISAPDRSRTIMVAIDPDSGPEDLVKPGHVFPLRAKPGGVLERAGHTEAAVDLARLAGLIPAGVICEISKDDGTMARVPDLVPYAAEHGLKIITIAQLIEHRRRTERLIERGTAARLPTEYRRVDRRGLPLDHRRQAPPGDGEGRRGRRRGACWCGCTPSASPATSSAPSAATAATSSRPRCGRSPRRARASCSTSPRRGAASACSTSCAPTSSRTAGIDTVEANLELGLPARTCATTASARRSSSTWGSARSGC